MPRSNPLLSYSLVAVQLTCLGLIALSGPLLASRPALFALEAAAGTLGIWAIWTMRPGNFNVTPDLKPGARLVTTGPYRLIRHPMYTALLLGSLALVLEAPAPLRIALWLILLIDLLIKLNYEERLLVRDLAGYAEHRKRTKRLLPFVL
jgi:protein-S-isoprenylcysteine O-methyltransferase Ste14